MSGAGPANHKQPGHQHHRQHIAPATAPERTSANHCGRMRSDLSDTMNVPGVTETKLLDLLKNEQTSVILPPSSNAMVDHVPRPRPLQTYPQISDAERSRTKPKISATPPPIPVRAPAVPKRTFIPPPTQQRTPIISPVLATSSTPRISAVPAASQPSKAAPTLPTLFIIPKPPSTSSGKNRSASIVSATSATSSVSDALKTDNKVMKESFEVLPQLKNPPHSSFSSVDEASRKVVPQLANHVLTSNQTCYTNVPLTISHVPVVIPMQKSTSNSKISIRQDSSLSSDSFSQTSSPSYTTKTMETPLIPPATGSGESGRVHYNMMSLNDSGGTKNSALSKKYQNDSDMKDLNSNGALIKSVSTPASLQTIVRFHNGSNMSLHHKIIKDMRRPSSHYVSRIRLHFRLAQVIVNAIALLAIGGGLAAYFKAYPSAVQIVNNVTIKPVLTETGVNPAPGICLPVIVSFCQYHKVPYNFTVFPNYMGHFGQRDAQQELEVYDAVVDVRCYELAALFLCSVFVPKCGPLGQVVRPCRSLCFETKRRCGFFLDVFGLTLPEYLECELFPESGDPDVCVGHHEVKEAQMRAQKPVCKSGFQCDVKRCIPKDWQCDGHVDCKDQTDELNCVQCSEGMIHCGAERCMAQEHMCDGKVDCPWAQDERNCLRLSEKNGDEGRGQLEVFRPGHQQWVPACITRWDQKTSALDICNLLGYASSNSSRIIEVPEKVSSPHAYNTITKWRVHPNKRSKVNLLKEFGSCPSQSYPTVDLSCTNYVCGKTRKSYAERATKRIVGGSASKPGDWPFLAALLGGPEEVFYCAGVLIADQWILTASHCVGNHSDVSGWTIQLGITRRHSHSYHGQKMKVRRVVPHPMYNLGVAHDNDVALFQLSTPVTFHEHLLPVCLPPANKELLPGTVCTVIGWGKKEDKDMSEYEPAVNEVEVPVLNRDLCNAWLINRDLNVTEGMICAGYKEGGKDACQGDSGGPLLCRDDKDSDRWFVGGIVSWGIKCAHPHLPGVYAYVPKYIPWIKKQMALYSD